MTHTLAIIAQAAPQPGIIDMLMPLFLVGIVFYFILWRPQNKERAKRQDMLAGIKKGDEVITVGGILGKVDAISDGVVTLDVSKGQKLRVRLDYVAGLQAQDESKS